MVGDIYFRLTTIRLFLPSGFCSVDDLAIDFEPPSTCEMREAAALERLVAVGTVEDGADHARAQLIGRALVEVERDARRSRCTIDTIVP